MDFNVISVLIAAILFLTPAVISYLVNSRTIKTKPGKLEKETTRLFSFVAMEYYWLILNRTFRIIVTEDNIYGVKVRGVISANRLTFDSDFVLHGDLKDPKTFEGRSFLQQYKDIDLSSQEFIESDSHNFRIRHHEVEQVSYNPKDKWGMGQIHHTGRLNLHLSEGHRREFILLGKQDGEQLRRRFEEVI